MIPILNFDIKSISESIIFNINWLLLNRSNPSNSKTKKIFSSLI
ncbi:hypothetical protein CY0110_18617 [Crocosphaera chwakensis CCY0110]|uniref:Uncharacterized protein n=1 Tax=Crocosphaera chwakensis CCY0110 TaxID=391612 RepID=A3IJ55_9CHRO|nr:hypothetical protein CY0110_18617 [Crocosphaera chwakensis CCY0110]